MGSFTRGDIVLANFPFTNLSGKKLRPCLVISEEMGEDVILCQITSKKIKRDAFCVDLSKDDTRKGDLNLDSYVRCNMLFTASIIDLKRKLCVIKSTSLTFIPDFKKIGERS